jgi:hypothetical protein
VVLVAAPAAGCSMRQRRAALPPLDREGEVYVYAMPFPREADRIAFVVESISAEPEEGGEAALSLRTRTLSGREVRDQRLVAHGRLAPGRYAGLVLRVGAATLAGDGGESALLVPSEPIRIPRRFEVRRRGGHVLWLRFRPEPSIRKGFEFAPAFSAELPPRTAAQRTGVCSNVGASDLSVFERGTDVVTGVVPTGEGPRGVAVDAIAGRAYVALSGDDGIDVVDLGSGEAQRIVRLLPGDRPREVLLTADRKRLLVLNAGSRTLALVDPGALVEIGRVDVGDDPWSMLVDAAGVRAYVLNRRSNDITVVDLARRALVGTARTDPEPLRAQLSRDGTRMYVIHAGSAYMNVLSVPELATERRIFVGLDATAIQVDPRTDLVYLAKSDERRVVVYDALSLLAVDGFEVPGAVSYMTIDEAENALVLLVPERAALAVIDLTSRRIRATMEVGQEPYAIALAGSR